MEEFVVFAPRRGHYVVTAVVPTNDEYDPLEPQSFAETFDELSALITRFGI